MKKQSGDHGQNVAFVLLGGGSLGAVQVGMLRALANAGIRPDLVVGTSIGAFNGVILAADVDNGAARLATIWSTLRRRDVLPIDARKALLGLLGKRDALFDNTRLLTFLERHMPIARLEQAPVPVVVTATDLHSGDPITIDRGSTVSAVLASSAIPGVLPPVERDGRLLVDGGVSSMWPVEVAVERGATDVYVLPTATTATMVLRRGALAAFERGVDLISERATHLERRAIAGRASVYEIPPPMSSASVINLKTTRDLMASAERSANRWIAEHVAVDGQRVVRLDTSRAAAPIRAKSSEPDDHAIPAM